MDETGKSELLEVLEVFMFHMESMQFNLASDMLKAESNRSHSTKLHFLSWADILSPLLLLTVCDRIYYSMTYLEPKWLGKDSLSNMYMQVLGGLQAAVEGFQQEKERAERTASLLARSNLSTSSNDGSSTVSASTHHSAERASVKDLFSVSSEGNLRKLEEDALQTNQGNGGTVSGSVKAPKTPKSKKRFFSPVKLFKGQGAWGEEEEDEEEEDLAMGSLVEDHTFFLDMFSKLAVLVQARLDMVGFYRSLGVLRLPPSFLSMVKFVRSMRGQYPGSLDHPLLEGMQYNMKHEMLVQELLYSAQNALQRFDYTTAVFKLYEANVHLRDWSNHWVLSLSDDVSMDSGNSKSGSSSSEVGGRHGGGSSRNHVLVTMTAWMSTLLHATRCKLALYFQAALLDVQARESQMHNDLNEAGSSSSSSGSGRGARKLNNANANASTDAIDYVHFVDTFTKKMGASNVSVVIDASKVEYQPEGYECPDVNNPYEAPQGLRSWPAVFSRPHAPPFEHWPNVISLIMENQDELDQYGTVPVYLYDSSLTTTYFIYKVEPVVYLLLIFDEKKKRDDKQVMQFLDYLGVLLRMTEIFEH